LRSRSRFEPDYASGPYRLDDGRHDDGLIARIERAENKWLARNHEVFAVSAGMDHDLISLFCLKDRGLDFFVPLTSTEVADAVDGWNCGVPSEAKLDEISYPITIRIILGALLEASEEGYLPFVGKTILVSIVIASRRLWNVAIGADVYACAIRLRFTGKVGIRVAGVNTGRSAQ